MAITAAGDAATVEGRLDLFNRVTRFNNFTLTEKETLARLATVRQVSAGGDVYIERQPADSFAIIAVGSLAKKAAPTKRPIGPPTMIGTLPLLHRNPRLRVRTTGLQAMADVVLVEIPYGALDTLADERKEWFLETIAEEAVFLIEKLDRTLPTS
jgi:hypothetical protein